MSDMPADTDDTDDNPGLLGIMLCERVLQDVLRRDAVSCINIYSGISAVAFPTVIPLVYAFAQLSSSNRQFEYQFRIEDDAGNLVAASQLVRVEPLANKHTPHKIITAFSGLTFETPGLYHVILEVGEEQLGSLPFNVQQLPNGTQEIGTAPA
jgi:hypothetical protein